MIGQRRGKHRPDQGLVDGTSVLGTTPVAQTRGRIEALSLVNQARAVLTDSGGVQAGRRRKFVKILGP
jgi:hypothetical protein